MDRVNDPDWGAYLDLADDIGIPTIGCRVLAYVNTEGKRDAAFCFDADDEQVYLLLGVLEEVKRQLLDLIRDEDDE